MKVVVRPEEDSDRQAVCNVNRTAFETEEEANLVDALRDGGYVEVDGEIVGHILFSRLPIITEGGMVDASSLAPMAVLRGKRGQVPFVRSTLRAVSAKGT